MLNGCEPEGMKSPRSVSLVVASVGYVALAVWCVWSIVNSSGNPRAYYKFRNSDAGFVYPTDDVIAWSIAIAVELVGILAFLRLARRTSPGVRLLSIVILPVIGIPVFGFVAMHAPPYYVGHLVWLLFAGAWSVVTAIAAGIEHSHRSEHIRRSG